MTSKKKAFGISKSSVVEVEKKNETPVSLGYPLSIFNFKTPTLRGRLHHGVAHSLLLIRCCSFVVAHSLLLMMYCIDVLHRLLSDCVSSPSKSTRTMAVDCAVSAPPEACCSGALPPAHKHEHSFVRAVSCVRDSDEHDGEQRSNLCF